MAGNAKNKVLAEPSTAKCSWNQRGVKVFPVASSSPRRPDTNTFICDHEAAAPTEVWSAISVMRDPLTEANSKQLNGIQTSGIVAERLRLIAGKLRHRTTFIKEWIVQPPTPATDRSIRNKAPNPPPLQRRGSSLQSNSVSSSVASLNQISRSCPSFQRHLYVLQNLFRFPRSIEPQGQLYISWLFVVTVCYLYNLFTITLRTVFSQYQTKDNLHVWITLDCTCDLFYLLDIILFKIRLKFLHDGKWLTEPLEIRKAYFRRREFYIDIFSLLPLDALYLLIGPYSILRIFRLLKAHSFWNFFTRLDEVLASPFIARMIKATIYMVYIIHFYALVYYGFSKHVGIGADTFVYSGEGNAYVRCYFFALKTATSIGKNPKPVNMNEQALMMCAWLVGVFIFAILIGQVKDIVLTATRNQDEYRNVVDRTLGYLHRNYIPQLTIDKVRLWFAFTWETQKVLDEIRPLKYLPYKMQLDIAMNVHIKTLSKVQLFQDCDENLLRDLVLKLKPVLYLPGDYVCKKGEVGKEMYIVQSGHVQVMGGVNNDMVLVTLSEGSVFGEISLLSIGGGNRRTADVRSEGFSQLFVLSKQELQKAILDYPQAQQVLRKKAEKLIKQNKEREIRERTQSPIIKSRATTPLFLRAVHRAGTLSKLKAHEPAVHKCESIHVMANDPSLPIELPCEQSASNDDNFIVVTIEETSEEPNTSSFQEIKEQSPPRPESAARSQDVDNQDIACWYAVTEEFVEEFRKPQIGRTFSIADLDKRIPSSSLPPHGPRGKHKRECLKRITDTASQTHDPPKHHEEELTLIRDLHVVANRYSNHGQNPANNCSSSNTSRNGTGESPATPNMVRVSSPFRQETKPRRGLLNFGTPPEESSASTISSSNDGKPSVGFLGRNGNANSPSLISISSRDSFDLSARIYNLSSESELEKLEIDMMPITRKLENQQSLQTRIAKHFQHSPSTPTRKSF